MALIIERLLDGIENSVKVRKASGGDVPRIAEIHVRSWQAAYRGILPDELLDGLKVSEREESWRALLSDEGDDRLTLVAEDSGHGLTGFCSVATSSRGGVASEATPEIGALYVDPDHWREEAGSAMLSAALAELRVKGWGEVVLWVLPENQPALAFYDRFGFAVEKGVEKREERSGRPVVRLRLALDEPIQQGAKSGHFDLDLYMDMTEVTRYGEHEIHERLKEIRDIFRKWTSGIGSGVLALSLEESREEGKRRRRRLEERERQREDRDES